jgi:hypothetical protein
VAAKRKPASAASASPDAAPALRRAAEAEARADQLAAKLAELAEDEGAAEAAAHFPTYDPAAYVLLSREDHSLLLRAKAEADRLAMEQLAAMAKGSEGLATFFDRAMDQNSKQREADLRFGNEMREQVAKLQADVAARDRSIADMQRQSEEAALERQRLAADVAQMRAANERRAMELDSTERMRALELDKLTIAARPTLDILGKLAAMYAAKEFGMPLPGLPVPAAPGATAPPPAAPGPSGPGYVISCADVEPFREVLRAVVDASGPETLGCTRAFLCSYFLAGHGAPPPPADLAPRFQHVVLKEVGQDRVMALLHACEAAYAPGAAASPASAAPSAPN